MSPDDSDTDSDGSTKNKRPRKQSKEKSQLEKTIKRLRSIHEDKWSLGEYRLWATALVNCRRCKHEPFSIVYFYEVSTCMILGFRVFNFFFREEQRKRNEDMYIEYWFDESLMRFVCSVKWLHENIEYSVISLVFFSVNSV